MLEKLSCFLLLFVCLSAHPAIPEPHQEYSIRSIGYKEYAPPEVIDRLRPAGKTAMAVHVEENHFAYTDNRRLMMRHAEAAAFSLFYGASRISGRDIPVQAWDINPFVGGVMKFRENSADRLITQYILDHATAVSLSMNTNGSRVAIKLEDIEELTEQWKSSHTIITQAAGNTGASYCNHRNPSIVEQQELVFHQLADTYAKIGSAMVVEGQAKIKKFSSCSSPDLVAENPYLKGLRYRFRPTASEFAELYRFHGDKLPGYVLNRIPSDLLEELEKKRRSNGGVDGDGHMTGMTGNSFVSPTVAGWLAGIKELCPGLSSFDLLGGAFAFAIPVPAEDGFP